MSRLLFRSRSAALLACCTLTACLGSVDDPDSAPQQLVIVGDSVINVTAPQSVPLRFRVLNSSGQGLIGVSIALTLSQPQDALSSVNPATDVHGNADVQWSVAPVAGEHIVTATTGQLTRRVRAQVSAAP